MLFRIAADLLVVLHFCFVLFVVAGGFLAWRWRWLAWIHIPAALWGALIEFMGWICPLTPLEVELRVRGGGQGYAGGFIEHYIVPILYPAGDEPLSATLRITFGLAVVLLNGVAYAVYFRRRPRGG